MEDDLLGLILIISGLILTVFLGLIFAHSLSAQTILWTIN